jgi:hypothetical protein
MNLEYGHSLVDERLNRVSFGSSMRRVRRFACPTRLKRVEWHETCGRMLWRFEELSGASPKCSRFARAGSIAILRGILSRGWSQFYFVPRMSHCGGTAGERNRREIWTAAQLGTRSKRDFQRTLHFTHVYMKRNGKWMLAALHNQNAGVTCVPAVRMRVAL